MVDNLQSFENSILTNISFVSGRYIKHGISKSMGLGKISFPVVIESINNQGKMIWIQLDNECIIKIVPAMSGRLVDYENEYTRFILETDNGNIYFNDLRNFGTIKIFDKKKFQKELNKLPFYPLNEQSEYTSQDVLEVIRKKQKNKSIALLLMDQSIFTGVGNYLRSEILYDTKTNVKSLSKDMSDKELLKLIESANKLMKAFYENPEKPFRIYGDKSKSQMKLKGRTVWFDPERQK